jgi:DNA mismatch repair protein MutS
MSEKNTREDSIVIEYFKLHQEYRQKYGKKTIVLMQVGSFFEVYGVKHLHNHHCEITEIQAFSEICSLSIADKKITLGKQDSTVPVVPFPSFAEKTPEATVTKSITKWINDMPKCTIVMAGSRDYLLEKMVQKITESGYTAVVFVQDKTDSGIVRKLSNIFSPGTFLGLDVDTGASRLTNNIMCIWIERLRSMVHSHPNGTLLCGTSTINIFTGESYLFEQSVPYFMNPTTFDELARNVSTISPTEVILISNLDYDTTQMILRYMGVLSHITVHCVLLEPGVYPPTYISNESARLKAINCSKQTYIHHILNTFFTEEVYETCAEFSSNAFATQSFCYLLNFIQEHNPDLIRKIHLPYFMNTSTRVILANHTLKQLNIINDHSTDGNTQRRLSSVVQFVNHCCTSMGKRKMNYQLTTPVFDEEWLQHEYHMIDYVQTTLPYEKVTEWRKQLRGMKDIDKITRQIISKRIFPSTIVHLHATIQSLFHIHSHDMAKHDELKLYLIEQPELETRFTEDILALLNYLDSRFLLEHCASIQSMTTFDQNFIRPGVSSVLDAHFYQQRTSYAILNNIEQTFNEIISQESSIKEKCIKIHTTDKSGISFQVTKKRGQVIKNIIQKHKDKAAMEVAEAGNVPHIIYWKDIHIVPASSNYDEITFPLLTKITKDLLHIQENMNTILSSVYLTLISEIETSWYTLLDQCSNYLSRLDILLNKVYVATEYKYCRPFLNQASDKSCVDAQGLRHCLIEHLQVHETYVTNDVHLGTSCDGILLYGTNAVGKTSIIRALGIAIILAQAGCYVPCTSFTYKPYRAIFSRILGNDNIFKGLSTFAVEMSELRMILKMADEHSLILGDELCSGTEIESALSIFLSGIMDLHHKQSSFIFATHFHEILHFEELKSLSRLAIKHMSVVYDREGDCLIYDRVLKDGPGNRMYGLEVCKSLHLPTDFLENAYEIRHKYFAERDGGLSHTTTHYNAQKIRGVCEVCHENMGEEIHHIQYQQYADQHGYIDHIHKNHPANLLSICHACHNNVHHAVAQVTIKRKKTTNGYKIQ